MASKQDLSLFQVSGEMFRADGSTIAGHANHLIHPGGEAEAQIVTDSSRDRQVRVDHLLSTLASPIKPTALLDVLQDRAPSGLPIYRDDPLDPDDENTLATALFELNSAGVSMQVYRQGQCAFDTVLTRTSPAQTGA